MLECDDISKIKNKNRQILNTADVYFCLNKHDLHFAELEVTVSNLLKQIN